MHASISGPSDPPDGSGFCPFPTWYLAHHAPKLNKLRGIITLKCALSNARLFFLPVENGHCLQCRGTYLLMIYSQLAPANQTGQRSMCCHEFFCELLFVYVGGGLGFNCRFTEGVKEEGQARKLQELYNKRSKSETGHEKSKMGR